MINEKHPFEFLQTIFLEEGLHATFSRYTYTPDSLFDSREPLTLCGDQLTKDRVNKEIEQLNSDQEFALHSKVTARGKNYHIPMIDFSLEKPIDTHVFDRMSKYLPKKIMLNMAIYESGRSYHGYSCTLLSPGEWTDFMGRLLLINQRNQDDIIDSRWIGHRLLGRFCSLRWSNNSGLYKGLPSRIKFPA